jgi:hypothetical protein
LSKARFSEGLLEPVSLILPPKPDVEGYVTCNRSVGSESARLDFMAIQPQPDFAHGLAERRSGPFDANAKGRFGRHHLALLPLLQAGARESLCRHRASGEDADKSTV